MIKNEKNNLSEPKDMGVVGQGKPAKNNAKCKKKPYKRIALACAHKQKNDRQNP
jgi:hypothetical protein